MCINSDFFMNKNEILLWFILIWKMINKYNLEQLSITQHKGVFRNDMSLKLQLSRTHGETMISLLKMSTSQKKRRLINIFICLVPSYPASPCKFKHIAMR